MMSDLRFETRDPVRPAAGSKGRSGFHLDRQNRKIFGVCAGMANALDVDVTLVRIAWIAGTLIGFGSLILIYLAIALLVD
ncbi:PspC domain-containing protein [Novosphingobium pituita]|jgi:phage shock protein C|nr:PspC domain-containing protein [Novosphingobium sp. IK01]